MLVKIKFVYSDGRTELRNTGEFEVGPISVSFFDTDMHCKRTIFFDKLTSVEMQGTVGPQDVLDAEKHQRIYSDNNPHLKKGFNRAQ